MSLTVLALPQVVQADDPKVRDPRAEGGMLAWPQDEMSRALGIYVPNRMKQFDVPGVAIAIVADGKIVYAGTFGKADKSAAIPVTPSTLFEAGALGQSVVAFGALRMADDKLLFLDAPLSRDLNEPWLSDDEDNAAITLRHVLTHTSGLGDNVAHPSRSSDFSPGSAFSHSGIGFLYLQHVMEVVGNASFEQLMQSLVFQPLGLTQSHFLPQPDEQLAQGYVPLHFLLLVLCLPFALAFLAMLAAFWAISWFMFQRRLEGADFLWPLLGAGFFASAIVWWGFGFATAAFVVGVTLLCVLVIALLAGFAYYLLYIAGLARAREGIITRGGGAKESLIVVLAGVIALGGFYPALNWSIPVLRLSHLRSDPVSDAAASFRTTAPDMGRFMIALLEREKLSRDMSLRLFADPVPAGDDLYWSLVAGMRRDRTQETQWARGSVMGFESLMVMDVKRRAGVVVLTNSRSGAELAQDIARNVLGVEAVWSLP
ncbi:MAG: serine hydrolase domain-containing protein [Parvibaculum sp.]|nr:serine hydrolase domain-containing protein [Parvibaculum sp.]